MKLIVVGLKPLVVVVVFLLVVSEASLVNEDNSEYSLKLDDKYEYFSVNNGDRNEEEVLNEFRPREVSCCLNNKFMGIW